MGRIEGRIERCGPIIDITVMATPQRVEALKAARLDYPAPKVVRGLIDTGASGSAIERSILYGMGLSPTGSGTVHTPSTGSDYQHCDLFDVSLALIEPGGPAKIVTTAVVAADLASGGICVLIGWDVLRHCTLLCDGPRGSYLLQWEARKP